MKTRVSQAGAGIVALVGGLLGLLNPITAQIASTTIAGFALVIMGLLQGRTALHPENMKERVGAAIFAVAGLFLGLSLLFGAFGNGSLLSFILGTLLLVSGAAKLWLSRILENGSFSYTLIALGFVSVVLGLLVFASVEMRLGFILSFELLVDGVALLILALCRKDPKATA
ncbi:DUF308 domain-containing protein [Roseovarius sp. MMSF_3281]|uniref:DUF308 domain-containing protein n=1 Tax=Roseovarius sp. MMSF_3281 TaxID=3046694 RepID=UPI00273F009C|nr:DUF308 domain-containing protein [Roseovarius sp. MMSF_3281]